MVVGKIEQVTTVSRYKPSAECLLPSSMPLQETISFDGLPKYVALVENIAIRYNKEVCSGVSLQIYDLYRCTGRDLLVLYRFTAY